MSNHFNRPGGNNNNVAASFGGFVGPTVNTDSYGLLHSFNVVGGFTEMPEIADRNAIPVYDNGTATHTGFTTGVDGYSTGQRRIGMLVYVMEAKKIYQLLPKGYFGNGGDGTFADFNALPEWERARLLHPTATNIFNDVFIPPPAGGPAYEMVPITGTADDCWVELTLGGGNTIDAINYDPQTGILRLEYDGNQHVLTEINTGNLFKFTAPGGSGYYSVDNNSDYVGGAAANQNPTLYVSRGETYVFRIEDPGLPNHPLQLRDVDGNAITAGMRAGDNVNGISGGGDTIVWQVPHDAANLYRYHCMNHAAMVGDIVVVSDGTSGTDGTSGIDGLSGVDGAKGEKGEKGC